MRRRVFINYALLVGVLGLLGLLLIYPILLTVRGGFYEDVAAGTGFTLRHLVVVFQDPTLLRGLVNAFLIAVATTALCMVLGLPLALLSANHRYPGKRAFDALILAPLILPPFVGAIGLKAILGRAGAVNALFGTDFDFLGDQGMKFWAVVIAEALHLYPILYLNAVAALANLDPALDESGRNLGAGPLRRFFTVTLPLVRPGLFAGGTIVFIWSFTELGTPLMLDFYACTPVQIFNGVKEMEASAEPYALTVVLLVAAVLLYLVGKMAFGGRGYAMYAKASRAKDVTPLGPVTGPLAATAFAAVIGLALIPHLGVVIASFAEQGSWYRGVLPERWTLGHYEAALSHPVAFGSIANSLKYAGAAVVLDLLLGLLIAYLIVRTRVRGRTILDALAMLPLAVPGLVLAFGYVAFSLRVGSVWPFREGDPLNISIIGAEPNPFILLVAAYAIRRLPYVVRSAVAGLEQTSGELEEAAVNLGASTFTAVRRIIVPLIMANLIAGGLLAFSFAMLEVSDSLILAQREQDFPITKAIFAFSERLGDGQGIASAMGVWGMALLGLTLVGASLLLGRKMGAIFRV